MESEYVFTYRHNEYKIIDTGYVKNDMSEIDIFSDSQGS